MANTPKTIRRGSFAQLPQNLFCVQKKPKENKKKQFIAQPTQRNVVPASKICEVKAGRGIMLVFYRLLTHSHTVMRTVSQSGASQAHIYNTHFTQLPATLETPHV